MRSQDALDPNRRARRITGTVLITAGAVLVFAALATWIDLFGLQLHVQNLLHLGRFFDSVQSAPDELQNAFLSNLVESACPLVVLIGGCLFLTGLMLRISARSTAARNSA